MHQKYVTVAAQHTLSILRWAVSSAPLEYMSLCTAFDEIYEESDFRGAPTPNDQLCCTRKSITFDGVQLAYYHFYGKEPSLQDIRGYLRSVGDNEDWGILLLTMQRGHLIQTSTNLVGAAMPRS